MSIGMTTDYMTFFQTAWLWEVIMEEITVEELVEATDCSLLEIVSDSLGEVVGDLLPGHSDELLAFAEALAETEAQPDSAPQDLTEPSAADAWPSISLAALFGGLLEDSSTEPGARPEGKGEALPDARLSAMPTPPPPKTTAAVAPAAPKPIPAPALVPQGRTARPNSTHTVTIQNRMKLVPKAVGCLSTQTALELAPQRDEDDRSLDERLLALRRLRFLPQPKEWLLSQAPMPAPGGDV